MDDKHVSMKKFILYLIVACLAFVLLNKPHKRVNPCGYPFPIVYCVTATMTITCNFLNTYTLSR